MEKLKVSNLDHLLRFEGYLSNKLVSDASILSCKCLVSENHFRSLPQPQCPRCQKSGVYLFADIEPLRELYRVITDSNSDSKDAGHQSLNSKKITVTNSSGSPTKTASVSNDSTNLMSLFYKYAKEEIDTKNHSKNLETSSNLNTNEYSTPHVNSNDGSSLFTADLELSSNVQPIPILSDKEPSSISFNSASVSPRNESISSKAENNSLKKTSQSFSIEDSHLSNQLIQGEQREYNFSKCFPFYRKLNIYSTQQSKINFTSLHSWKSSSVMRKSTKFIGSDIYSYIDPQTGNEITTFVLITTNKWELYEYIDSFDPAYSSQPPRLVCCGKSTGEYGLNYDNLIRPFDEDGEIVIKNDFGGMSQANSATSANNKFDGITSKYSLKQWDHIQCCLTANYLLIYGTRGIMRLFNVSKTAGKLGRPIYTYCTTFPIRCASISPDESIIACGITARERLSNKEQPFVIIHKLKNDLRGNLKNVEPFTITIPYRDPLKFIKFSPNSNLILCCTVWESRYLIIKLTDNMNENYRKPRLIWSDIGMPRKRSNSRDSDQIYKNIEENDIMMENEGVTDMQFGSSHSNLLVMAACSLNNRYPVIIRLDGCHLDSGQKGRSTSAGTTVQDLNSNHSRLNSGFEEEISNSTNNANNSGINATSSLNSSEVIMKIPEVGSTIHRFCLSPRGDGMVFLDKSGHLFLVSIPNFQLHPQSPIKKIVVQLGEASNAERYRESASVSFSKDGGKIFVVDRKGVFQVFDFTKGIPGNDSEIVKCKLVNI